MKVASLTSAQQGQVEIARALADASDAGYEALAEYLNMTDGGLAVYARAFGAAGVHMRNLLGIIDELTGGAR